VCVCARARHPPRPVGVAAHTLSKLCSVRRTEECRIISVTCIPAIHSPGIKLGASFRVPIVGHLLNISLLSPVDFVDWFLGRHAVLPSIFL